MSKQVDKATVLRTTKVRTRLRDDGSWLQQRSDAQAEAEEKPWLAEVRAGRLNGAPVETSPVSSPTTSTPPPTKPDAERVPSSGYLIRGVFTKLDKPASSSTTNGVSGTTTQFTKKPSETYKKIAPYTVRPTPDNQENQLSNEEQEKRTEAASNVLKKTSVRQRSYVLSAAKKFESQEQAPDTSLVNSIPSFVAKRVEITDDEKSAATPAPASTPSSSHVVPVTSVASAPELKPQKIVDTSVKTAVDVTVNEPVVAPKVEEAAPEPVKEDPPPVYVAVKDPFEDMTPGCTKVATPLPELIPEYVQAGSTEPEPDVSDVVNAVNEPVAPKVEEAAPEPVKEDPLPVYVAVKDPFEDMTPGCTKVATPLPELIPEYVQAGSTEPEPDVSDVVNAVNEPVAPKVEEAAPEPVKEDPLPVYVAVKDPFEDMTPGCTKVATPLPELIPEYVQTVCIEPEPEAADVVNAVNEPEVAPKVEEAAPEPVKEDLPPEYVAVKDPFEDMTPGCTKVATPLPELIPELIPEYVQTVCIEPEPEAADVSGQVDTPLVDLAPASPTPVSPTPASPAPASPVPLSPVPLSAVTEITVKTEPEPEPESESEPEPEPEPEPAPAPAPAPKPRSNVDTLTALSDTLISFGTSSTSLMDDEPVLAEEEGGSADGRTTEDGAEQEPAPELSNCITMTDDLLALTDGPEELAEPVPPSPGRWSQDLLSGLDSESSPAKTSSTLDLLANDVIPINTVARSLSTQRKEIQTDETATETQSSTETVTITTKTVIITDKSQEDNADPWSSYERTTVTESSSADPFDPYPIGTTSSNSSSDLLQPLSHISISSVSPTYMENKDPSPETNISSNALESLADNVIPISTDTTRLSSHRSWARTWDTSTPQQADTEESQEAVPGGQTVDQQTMVMFERKSTENDSPWDRWTSPTIYTVSTTTEEEEEESSKVTQTETITTITTIREIHSDSQHDMERYDRTYSRTVIEEDQRVQTPEPEAKSYDTSYSRTVTEEDQRVQTPEPEAKRGFVYVKEYVNATELSLYNARDTADGDSDYLTSGSTSYSYSSPSTYSSGSLSTTCSFCKEKVGNDAKITIEHLNINCHPTCFKCGVCSKPMGDLMDSMFIHGGKVHCESCYCKALD